MMILSKTYNFEVAHMTKVHKGVHGHSYEVEICIEGEGDYVLPLHELDAFVAPILAKIDHTLLNDIIPVPTMENIARWFAKELNDLPLNRIIITRPTLKTRCILDRF